MQGLKCFVYVATSHGSHEIWWLRNLALKNPARCNFLARVTYKVAAIPGFLTAPSVRSKVGYRA